MTKNYAIPLLILMLPTLGWGIDVHVPSGATLDPVTGSLVYQEVVQIPGKTSKDLWAACKAWIEKAYAASSFTRVSEDEVVGKIVVTGRISTLVLGNRGLYDHTFIIELKDGRYRYTISVHSYLSAGVMELSMAELSIGSKNEIYEDVDRIVLAMISSLKTSVAEDGNW